MKINILARKKYLEWEEYKDLIIKKECLILINSTMKNSIRNLIKKEVVS